MIQFPPSGAKGFAQWLAIIEKHDPFDDLNVANRFQTPEQPDDTPSLVRVVAELASDSRNGVQAVYEAGQSFGHVFADLERWNLGICQQVCQWESPRCPGTRTLLEQEAETQFLDPEYRNGKYLWKGMAGNEAKKRYRESVDRLLSHKKVVCTCPHPEMSLRSGWVSSDESLQLREAQATVSLALGGVLGSMYQADSDAYIKDMASPMPRMFMLGPQASLDRIKGQVYVVEQMFDTRDKLHLRPEDAVFYSANLIEGLAKDLWAAEFSISDRSGGVRNILREHCQSENEDERRFASIALALYMNYRNPSQHDAANFRCTWHEAWFFHTGTRTLVELSDKIKNNRASAK